MNSTNEKHSAESTPRWLRFYQDYGQGIILTLIAAYLGASTIATLILPYILESLKPADKVKLTHIQENIALKSPNYHDIKQEVIARNLFNSEGKVPVEIKEEESPEEEINQTFDTNAPCNPPNIPIKLVGIINSNTPLAIIEEKGFPGVEIYKKGELIVEHDLPIHSISDNQVVINDNGKKVCLDLATKDGKKLLVSAGVVPSAESHQVDGEFVSSELGEGYSKILSSARLVPLLPGQGTGYRILDIKDKSLFDVTGFKHGDILIRVNQTTMTAENGFALYQAFLEEEEITVHLLRKGKDDTEAKPYNIQIKIK